MIVTPTAMQNYLLVSDDDDDDDDDDVKWT